MSIPAMASAASNRSWSSSTFGFNIQCLYKSKLDRWDSICGPFIELSWCLYLLVERPLQAGSCCQSSQGFHWTNDQATSHPFVVYYLERKYIQKVVLLFNMLIILLKCFGE